MARVRETFLFGPTSIASCQLWLDAADPSNNGTQPANGSTLTSWVDRSGNARNLGVGSGTTTWNSNSVRLNSSHMFVTSAVNLTTVSFFIVVASPTSINNQTVLVGRPNTSTDFSSTDGFGFYVDFNNGSRVYGSIGAGQFTQVANTGSTAAFMTSSVFQSTGAFSSWTNGGSQLNATPSARTSTAQGFAIGASWNGSLYNNNISSAFIYEIVVYNTALAEADRQRVEGYLAWKWGLQGSLPSNHPFKTYRTLANPPIPTSVPTMPLVTQTVSVFQPTQLSDCQLWLDAADASTVTAIGGVATLATFVQVSPTTSTVTYTGTLSSLSFLASGTCLMQGGFINVGNGNGFLVPSATIGDFYALCYDVGFCKVVKMRFTLVGATLSVTGLSAGFSTQNVASTYMYISNSPSQNDTLYTSYSSMALVTTSSGSGYGVANFSLNFAAATSWRDKSTITNNASNSGTAPTYDAQGRFMRFNGSTQAFSLPNGTLPTGDGAYTIFILSYTNTFATNQYILVGGTEVTNQALIIYYALNTQGPITYNAVYHSWWNNDVAYILNQATFPVGTVSFTYNAYSSSLQRRYQSIGGRAVTTNIPDTTRNNPNTGNFIGRQISGAAYFNGGVGEVIVYNRLITESEQQQVEGYLAWKWGLQSAYLSAQLSGSISPYALNPIAPFPFRSVPFVGSLNQWLPNQVSGCQLWLDAADSSSVTLSGSSVTQWRDKSANALVMSQLTQANAPTVTATLNGQNVLGFTTLQNMTSTANLTLSPGQTMIALFNPLTTTNYFFMEHGPNVNTTDGSYLYGSNADLFGIKRGVTTRLVDNPPRGVAPFVTNNWYFISVVNSNASTATTDVYWSINGVQLPIVYNGANNGVTSGTATNLFYLNPSARVPASNYCAEIIIYNSALTVPQVNQVEGYLAWKWGLVGNLPANHPFKLFPPPP